MQANRFKGLISRLFGQPLPPARPEGVERRHVARGSTNNGCVDTLPVRGNVRPQVSKSRLTPF